MKISYKNLKKSLPFIGDEYEVAEKLITHTAEVEEIISKQKDFENIVFGKITKIEAHPDADSLRVCKVDVGENEDVQIVCGGSNLEVGQGVAVAKIGAKVSWHGEETITMKKTKIRGVESNGIICASDEIGLAGEFPAKDSKEILDLSFLNTSKGTNLAKALEKDDVVLEVDNKAINHRPDLFSHIGIKRELATIYGKKFDEQYAGETDFLNAKNFEIENQVPEKSARYMALKISGVGNIKNNFEDILEILEANGVDSKGLLVDLSNYSLYYYGQPTHIFDADKINGKIIIRNANPGEKFVALDDKEYELTSEDIVIADEEKILALAGIIGAKDSAVSSETKNIIIESANFDQAVLRKTGKSCGIRTDSLNLFEKGLLPEMAYRGLSLIYKKLKEVFPNLKIEAFGDNYPEKQEEIFVDYDLDFINDLIGKKYENNYVLEILERLGIEKIDNKLKIPFWRKDLNYKADIAEEIARTDSYDNIESKVLELNSGAVIQDNLYKVKNDARDFFVNRGFFDTYNYSFVGEDLYKKIGLDINDCVSLKNYLSLDATHLRNSLVPNILQAIEDNIREFKELKIFELEKIFTKNKNDVEENYSLAVMRVEEDEKIYYKIVNELQDFFARVGIKNYFIDTAKNFPVYAHPGRVGSIIVRGKEIGIIGEIHPTIAKRFGVEKSRIGFFEINIDKIKDALYSITKAKEISVYQENNFDLSFVVDKKTKAKDIVQTILATDKQIIDRVELFDIYENKEKLPGKRSLSFKIFIQSLEGTLDDKIKNELIEKIVEKVKKKGGELR